MYIPTKKGNLLKVRYIADGALIKTFNRGKDPVEVTCIAFNDLCMRMAVASKKETVHVFALPKEISEFATARTKSRESVVSDFLDVEDLNNNSSLLESRHGHNPSYFGKLFRGEGETSYLKVYVDHPDKLITISHKQLVIARPDGIVQHVNIQCQGKLYETDEEKVKKQKLF